MANEGLRTGEVEFIPHFFIGGGVEKSYSEFAYL